MLNNNSREQEADEKRANHRRGSITHHGANTHSDICMSSPAEVLPPHPAGIKNDHE